jgi:orotate phosphoribosyltransferase-like protein
MTDKKIAEELNMNRETVGLILTEGKNLIFWENNEW